MGILVAVGVGFWVGVAADKGLGEGFEITICSLLTDLNAFRARVVWV